VSNTDVARIAVVSGGARGLGLGIVSHLLERGFRVASFSRSMSTAVHDLQERFGPSFYFEAMDLTDGTTVPRFARHVAERLGKATVLVNNAGVAVTGVMSLFSDDDIDKVIDLNLKGTMRLTRSISRMMLAEGGGRIVNISSIVGLSGYRGLSVYSASKAALDGYTRALARELGSRKITVNSIAPGFMQTEMSHALTERQVSQIERRTPVGRLGSVDDILGVLDLLVSDKADFITGQVIVVDGGLTC
jgi:3-oxoacyl-[acyl-carrier protein] reductase